MGKEATRNTLKNNVLENVMQYLRNKYDTDVEKVSTSECMMPAVDDEGNEFYYMIKITVPRGHRNNDGTYAPYDGYAAAQQYALDIAAANAEKAAKQKEKERVAKEKERKKAAKALVKKLNTDGLDAIIHEEE